MRSHIFIMLLVSVGLGACASNEASESWNGAVSGKADEVGAACAGDDELAVMLCLSDGCPGLSGESLQVCLQETCGQDLDATAADCTSCVFGHVDGGAAAIESACVEPSAGGTTQVDSGSASSDGSADTSGTAGSGDTGAGAGLCTGDDAEAVGLCLSDGCPDLHGEDLTHCLQETCGEDLARADGTCEACVLEYVDGGAAAIQSQCL